MSAGFVVCLVAVAARAPGGSAGRGAIGQVATNSTAASVAVRRSQGGSPGGSAASGPTTRHPALVTTTTAPAPTSTTVDVGALPQTAAQPTTHSARFLAGARSLWDAAVADDPDLALGFFFPLSAYRQVKDLPDPATDWRDRLVADFRTDVHALHEQLGSAGSSARFERLDVPDGAAEWIDPGVEYNKGSYWRVYGSTLRYVAGGVEHSLPVSSLISWRGEWYVVHLGAIR